MIIVITGPTAVGKTKLSVALAKIYNGEIINADSTQVYKGMDIGTAKVTKEEMEGVKHHLLDIKEVTDDYSVFDYQRDARKKIKEIQSKGKVPILVGGTGYYIKAALYNYVFDEETLKKDYSNLSLEDINNLLDNYNGIEVDKNNRRRCVRLLEKLESDNYQEQKDFKLLYDDVLFIGLTTNRDILYERIDKRLDDMFISLVDEVKPFYLKNIHSKALKTAIGYKELYEFFDNKKTLKEVNELIKQTTRNYAKKQYTWFNNQMNIKWFNVNFENFSNTVSEIVSYIEKEN